MRHLPLTLAPLAILVISAVNGAGITRADDQSYLSYLRDNGVPLGGLMIPSDFIQYGDTACRLVRGGMTPQDAAQQFGPIGSPIFGSRIVDAAQHELCPDTLGNRP